MKLSNKVYIHHLTVFMFFISFLTGYAKYLFYIFLIVLIHELGHVIFARLLKRKITRIEILPFGGLTKMDSLISENIYEDLLIAVGGIFTQVLFGFYLEWLNRHFGISVSTFEFLKKFNLTIIIFNMLPICPLDGYKILSLGFELFTPYRFSFKISEITSIIVLVSLGLLKISLIKDNILIFAFLIFMLIKEMQNTKYILNRFYLERILYDFKFRRIDIKHYKNMYKNRINYINGIHEKKVLYKLFSKNDY